MASFIESLVKDLRSNDQVVRCGILGRIENHSWTPEQVEELRRLAAGESDRRLETSLMLLWRIASADTNTAGRFDELAKLLQQPVTDISQILLRLKSLPAADCPRAAELLRLRGLGGLPDAALPWLYRFFREHGSAGDAVVIKPGLGHSNPMIVRAAFEALEQIAPDELRPVLVKFLLNPLPEIRSLAIRLLQRWDPAEALRHLEAMLFDPNPEEQKAALYLVFYFRFDQVEPLMLRFLSLGEDLDLLGRARDIFMSNPLPESPLKLVEIMEASSGEKQKLIREIVLGVIDSLVKAGLVERSPQELIAELQTSWKQRKVSLLFERCRQALASPNPAHRHAARTRLQELAGHGFEEAHRLLDSLPPDADVPAGPGAGSRAEAETLPSTEAPATPNPDSPPAKTHEKTRSATSDKRRRLDELATRLLSVQPERRYEGLLEAGNHDFPSIRDLLLTLAERETVPENRTLLRGLLEPHLDAAMLARLFAEVASSTATEDTAQPSSPVTPAPQVPPPEYALSEIAAVRCAGDAASGAQHPTPAAVALPPSGDTASNAARQKQAAAGNAVQAPSEFTDLQSTDPTIRFLALMKLDSLDWNPILDDLFRSLMAGQNDPVDRFLMELSLARRERRRRPLPRESTPPVIRIEQLLTTPNADFKEIALRFEALNPREGKLAVARLRKLSWTSFPIGFLPQLLTFIRQHGGPEDGAAIEPFCRHADPRVVLPAIEALEELNPEDLKPLLVLLLSSPSQGVRSRAVRLLYRWDREEAIRHFEATLFARHPAERQLALYHAWFLPFAAIEPHLIRFLDIEDNLGLLTLAGYLIQSNPDPQLPMKLIGIMETCSDEKRILIGGLVAGVAQTLSAAGLIDCSAGEFHDRLKQEWVERRERARLEQCRLALAGKDPSGRASALPYLEALLASGRPEALELLSAATTAETDPTLKARFQTLTGMYQTAAPAISPAPGIPTGPGREQPPSSPAAARAIPRNADPATLSAQERLRWLAGLDAPTYRTHRAFILNLAGSPEIDEDLRAAAVRAIGQFGEIGDGSFVRKFIGDTRHRLAAAAIDALSNLDPAQLQPFLAKLVQHAAEEIRNSAFRSFLKLDKRQAIAHLEQLLGSGKPEQRRAGIFAAGHVEFPTIQELLLAALGREDHPENLRQLGALLKSNLTVPLVVKLLALRDAAGDAGKSLLTQLLDECAVQLHQAERSVFPSPAAVLEKAARELAAEAARKAKPSAPYALKNIQKLRQQQEPPAAPPAQFRLPAWIGEIRGKAASLAASPRVVLGAAVVVSVGLAYSIWSYAPEAEADQRAPTAVASDTALVTARLLNYTPAPFQIGEERDIQGMIKEAWSDAIRVKVGHQPQLVHIRAKNQPRPFKAGYMFRGRVKLTKVTTDSAEAELMQLY